jgi:hypothetical protein
MQSSNVRNSAEFPPAIPDDAGWVYGCNNNR